MFGDKMYIFGGHTITQQVNSQEISNELFSLDMQAMAWAKMDQNS